MELARADALAKKGINWGRLTFEHLRRNDEASLTGKAAYFSTTRSVKDALEANILTAGVLNGSGVLSDLSVEDQCSFFSCYPKCEKLVLQGWTNPISDSTLRCISIVMGESLLELDMSYSSVTAATLEIMLSHVQRLKVVRFSSCPNLDSVSMGLLAKYAGHTVTELYVDNCPQFRLEPLLALSGSVGFNAGGLRKLQILDLSDCPVDDRGLVAISKGYVYVQHQCALTVNFVVRQLCC